MRLGVCYYPEQWHPERWPIDASMMREAGFDLVRIGEFAWSAFEPSRGRFAWDWLDRAIDTLASAGLQIMLGTPTATPPVWLIQEHPDVLLTGSDGHRRAYGSRRHTCPTSPAYRAESRRIVSALVERYGDHEAVTAWQIDNEVGNHDSARCWCGACQSAFSLWLHDRFGTIERLNEAWGTAFWSQTYPSFDAVSLPVPTMTAHSPSLLLAHRRFSSAQAVAGLAAQVDLVRAGSPGRDILTNHFLGDPHVDHADAARLTGIVGHDNYPHGYEGPYEVSFTHDLCRGLAGPAGRGWVVEQQPGPINWTPTNPPVPPGQVRLWSWQAALHGIETLLFFRWRAATTGQEQYHSGLLRHDASPDRGLAEATRMAAELRVARDTRPALLQRPTATVALLFAKEDSWAIEIDPHRAGLTHRQLVLGAYEALTRLGIEVDILSPADDLDGYELIVAPACHLATAARIDTLNRALDRGSVVVLGPRSMVKTEENTWATVPQPAGLAERLGARVAEGLSQNAPPGVLVALGARPAAPAGPWTDVLEPTDFGSGIASVMAGYVGDSYLDGAAAAVRSPDGRLIYAGFSSADAWVGLLARLLDLDDEHKHGVEVFARDRKIVLDHHAITSRGLPGD